MLLYVHILLMVFWIGTDLGVYLAGLRFMDPKRSLEERTAVISLGMVTDRIPRICFVAVVPVGLELESAAGAPELSPTLLSCAWLLSGVWIAAVIAGMRLAGTPRARGWHRIERFFQIACLIGFTAVGIGSLAGFGAGLGAGLVAGHGPLPGWLAGKWIAYGAICGFVILLEHSFGPVMGTFAAITTEGSTPEREASLRNGMVRTYVWVLAIYAAVVVSGYLGTVKP